MYIDFCFLSSPSSRRRIFAPYLPPEPQILWERREDMNMKGLRLLAFAGPLVAPISALDLVDRGAAPSVIALPINKGHIGHNVSRRNVRRTSPISVTLDNKVSAHERLHRTIHSS